MWAGPEVGTVDLSPGVSGHNMSHMLSRDKLELILGGLGVTLRVTLRMTVTDFKVFG